MTKLKSVVNMFYAAMGFCSSNLSSNRKKRSHCYAESLDLYSIGLKTHQSQLWPLTFHIPALYWVRVSCNIAVTT